MNARPIDATSVSPRLTSKRAGAAKTGNSIQAKEGQRMTKTMEKRLDQMDSGVIALCETIRQVSKALCGKENATQEELLQAVSQVKNRLAQVERERDAAVKDLADACKYCKHISCDDEDENSPCKDCMQRKRGVPFAPMIRTRFEWRGVCEENTKEE